MRPGHHLTETPLGPRLRRRTIRNWSNFKTPSGGWREAKPGIAESNRRPPDWDGTYDFAREQRSAALQAFFGDTTDPVNRAMVGMRLAERPSSWFNLKALDVLPGAQSIVTPRSQAWREPWTKATLRFDVSGGKVEKRLILRTAGHDRPAIYRFSLRLAPGHTVEFADNGARILDDEGVERFRLRPPWGEDSATTYPTMSGAKRIRVQMHQGTSRMIGGRLHQVIRLVVNQDDLDGAVYPVTIDPTTVILAADIEDAHIIGGVSSPNNFGASAISQCWSRGASASQRHLCRVLEAALPAGTITGFRFKVWRIARAATNGNTMLFTRVLRAWGEGAGDNVPATAGENSWNHYTFPSLWTVDGADSDGNDIDRGNETSAVYAAYPTGPDIEVTFTLPNSWVENWRLGGSWDDDGFLMNILGDKTGIDDDDEFRFHSTAGAKPPTFEVDFEVIPSVGYFFVGF
jgi:hypothetical protein